jgi:hypothetical protein
VGYQVRGALEGVQRGPHLLAGQDDWQPLRALLAHDIVEPRQIQLEYRTVEEQECAQRWFSVENGSSCQVASRA